MAELILILAGVVVVTVALTRALSRPQPHEHTIIVEVRDGRGGVDQPDSPPPAPGGVVAEAERVLREVHL